MTSPSNNGPLRVVSPNGSEDLETKDKTEQRSEPKPGAPAAEKPTTDAGQAATKSGEAESIGAPCGMRIEKLMR